MRGFTLMLWGMKITKEIVSTKMQPDHIIDVCDVKVSLFVDMDESIVSFLYDKANLTSEIIEEIEAEIEHLAPKMLDDYIQSWNEAYFG